MLLVHRRDVIEPVEIRDRLQVGPALDQLLGAAVQQPDMRIDALDHFAVELEHEPQHAVRRRMLRAEIDGEVAAVRFGHRRGSSMPDQASRIASRHANRRPSRPWPRRVRLNLSHSDRRSVRGGPRRSDRRRRARLTVKVDALGQRHCDALVLDRDDMPGGVAARWLTSTCTPTLPSPGSRCRAPEVCAGPFHQDNHVPVGEHLRHGGDIGASGKV